MPVIPSLGMLKQEGQEFKAKLGYIVSLCLKKQSSSNSCLRLL